MILLIFLGILSAAGVAVTIHHLRLDGYRRIPTDHSRLP